MLYKIISVFLFVFSTVSYADDIAHIHNLTVPQKFSSIFDYGCKAGPTGSCYLLPDRRFLEIHGCEFSPCFVPLGIGDTMPGDVIGYFLITKETMNIVSFTSIRSDMPYSVSIDGSRATISTVHK